MSDFFLDNPEKNGAQFTDTFSFRQIGSITTVVEPVSAGNTIESLNDIFHGDESLQAVPIERNGAVVGILDRNTIENLNSSAWQKFWQKELDKYIKETPVMLQANDFIEKNMDKILEMNRKNDSKFFSVYFRRNFLGIVGLHDFLQRVTEIRNQDMAKAQTVQENLLEKDENVRELPFSLTTWNKMANEVGGDFYKCFCVEKDKKYIVGCFDVSGKNVSAALSTMAIGSFFSALKHFNSPVKFGPAITALLDNYIEDITPVGMFTTAAICYIDLETETVSVQNCGHTPVFVFEPEDSNSKKISVKTVNPNLPPLGMGAIASQPQTALILPIKKDLRIVLYSDGLTDMQSPDGLRFEDKRTKELFIDTYRKTPDELTEKLNKTIHEWIADAMLIDDITILDVSF